MNKLVYITEDNETVVFKENVSDEALSEFVNCQNDLRQVMASIDYYNIVRGNIIELMNAIIEYDVMDRTKFTTINRYFMNMINSFYTYLSFYERFYNGMYGDIFSEQFDKYDTYKIIYELRRYTTHCFLPITKGSINLLDERVCIEIDPKELLENDQKNMNKITRQVLDEMVKKNEIIDLRILTGDFLQIFLELQVKIMDRMKEDVFRNYEILDKYTYGKNLNKKESYIIKEDDSMLNTSNIFYMFLDKFEHEYVPLSEIAELLSIMHEKR